MRGAASGPVPVGAIFCLLALAAGLLLAGCTSNPTAPSGPQGANLPSYMVHVAGANDRGSVILIGRATCPWCQKDKALLSNLSVDYYWVDLNNLNNDETTQVISSVKFCPETDAVPILVIHGQECIVGYNETQIREALK
ncbi:MAG TPA: glutaredoxin domain-containing protein [Methanomicrobiales archaeon]|nr:glutaredoxin domain-containing protein [Methanomicrobiales archaeon]